MSNILDGGASAPRVCVRDGDKKLIISRAYPPQFYDLAIDPHETDNLAGTGDPDEERLTQIAEQTWPLDTLLDEVIRSQTEPNLIDAALSSGREEIWDFMPRSLAQNTTYVRRGDAFPVIERRRYLSYPDKTQENEQ